MHADHLIAEFAQQAGLPTLALSEDGTARLIIDRSLEVQIEHEATRHRLHLYTSLGGPPSEDKAAWLERLLVANFFGRDTDGATLCLDPVKQEALLVLTLELDTTTPVRFENALQSLVDAHEHLQLQLAPAHHDPTAGEPDFARIETGFMRA
ncbi:MAG: type III secretion system chaperone [Opitutaceae bacterium]|nr:type III secretion system chaperone [Opitutaceae bacterium]